MAAVLVAIIGVGVLAFWRPGSQSATASASAPAAAATGSTADQKPASPSADDPRAVARAESQARFGPHKQANLPSVPFQAGYEPPRPPAVVMAAYQFAAEHPEILSYIPCFCGCERAGHQGNTDCFVRSRAINGDVLEWDEHGVDCAVCLDVATRSRQMYSSGASVRDIRAAIDKEFGQLNPSAKMPTPHPPTHDH
jgi:TPR repeat protein